jgi:hypothetical protein
MDQHSEVVGPAYRLISFRKERFLIFYLVTSPRPRHRHELNTKAFKVVNKAPGRINKAPVIGRSLDLFNVVRSYWLVAARSVNTKT